MVRLVAGQRTHLLRHLGSFSFLLAVSLLLEARCNCHRRTAKRHTVVGAIVEVAKKWYPAPDRYWFVKWRSCREKFVMSNLERLGLYPTFH